MNENSPLSFSGVCARFAALKLPRWQELPDLDLYMDQVLALIDRYLGGYPGFDGKVLTSSMVNNYVKLGVMPAPVKKKYTRTHLAHLIVICILKASLPIASIQRLISHELGTTAADVLYDRFCGLFEQTDQAVAQAAGELAAADSGDMLSAIYYAALRAQAEQALALKLIDALLPADEPPQSGASAK